VIGAVYAGDRLDGVVSARVRRDGRNSTAVLTRLVRDSRFAGHLQGVLLQGIALAGFNVVDVPALSEAVGLPVLVVARRRPDLPAIREALLTRVPGGRRKWALIERLQPMEPLGGVYVQAFGFSRDEAAALLERYCIHSLVPEPLRTAHLIAGGIARGESRHRV
jgi:hypothetical protein